MFRTLFVFLLAITLSVAAEITPELHDKLLEASPLDRFEVVLQLGDQVELDALTRQLDLEGANRQRRHRVVVDALRAKAKTTQSDLITTLEAMKMADSELWFVSFWTNNSIEGSFTAAELFKLSTRPELQTIGEPDPISIPTPVAVTQNPEPPVRINAWSTAETNLLQINAHLLWAMGITGKGVLLSELDSGVDGTHPALKARWRGTKSGVKPQHAWLAASPKDKFPTDDSPGNVAVPARGHGTHVMGTMCGSTGSHHYGVAPEAEWIAARIQLSNVTYGVSASSAFQWLTDPDGNSSTVDDVPVVVNNSWGTPGGVGRCYTSNYTNIDACEAAGVAVIWAAGNEGTSGAQTINSPASRVKSDVNVFAVGAVDKSNKLADFSSRGPSPCDRRSIKPEVVAPGMMIVSCWPDSPGTHTAQGTSMASPHVAGAVALLAQLYPDLKPDDYKYALLKTARDLGELGEENDYGNGVIDVAAAAAYLSPYWVKGTVIREDKRTVPEPVFIVKETGQTFKGELNGTFNNGIIRDSVITLRVTAFGMDTVDVTASIKSNVLLQKTITLTAKNHLKLSGSTVDQQTSHAVGGKVYFYNYDAKYNPIDSATISAGKYEVKVPAGMYDLEFKMTLPYPYRKLRREAITKDKTFDYKENPAELMYYKSTRISEADTAVITAAKETNGFALWEKSLQGELDYGLVRSLKNASLFWNNGDGLGATVPVGTGDSLASLLDAGVNLLVTGANVIQTTQFRGLNNLAHMGLELYNPGPDSGFVLFKHTGNLMTFSSKNVKTISNFNSDGFKLPSGSKSESLFNFLRATDNLAGAYQDAGKWRGVVLSFDTETLTNSGPFILREELLSKLLLWVHTGIILKTPETKDNQPRTARLIGNFPNPFNPETRVVFELPTTAQIQLKIFDLSGRLINTIASGQFSGGIHHVTWNGKNAEGQDVASGVYFSRLILNDAAESISLKHKLILLR